MIFPHGCAIFIVKSHSDPRFCHGPLTGTETPSRWAAFFGLARAIPSDKTLLWDGVRGTARTDGVGLIDRFQNIFKRNEPAPTASTVTAVAPPYRPSALSRLMAEETDRRTLVRECMAMYRNDTRAREILQAVARDATRGGFELVVEGPRAVEAKAIATDMLERVDFW